LKRNLLSIKRNQAWNINPRIGAPTIMCWNKFVF